MEEIYRARKLERRPHMGGRMTHLLDTNICSAHMRRPGGLAHCFFQYAGGLTIPTIVLAELYGGACHHSNPNRLLALTADPLHEVALLDFDACCRAGC